MCYLETDWSLGVISVDLEQSWHLYRTRKLCNSKCKLVGAFTIKKPDSASAARARGVLIVKILTIVLLVYDLILDRKRNILYTPQYFHTPVYWLSS